MADDQLSDFVPSLWEQVLSALNQGNIQAVLSLLETCSRDELPQENCWVHTLLKWPLAYCHPEVVKLLVERFHADIQSLKGSPDGLLEEALVEALFSGDDFLVEKLVKMGVDVNLPTLCHMPLTIACLYGRLSMVKLLLENGANVNLKGRDGMSPLTAAMIIQEDMVVQIVKYLLDHGADINLQAERGTSALHTAVLMGNTELVKWVLARQAQVLKDDNGFTPLFLAVDVHRKDIFNVILDSNFISLEDKVNMLEFKAASLAPNDMNGVYRFLRQAMEKRYEDSSNILKKPVCEPVAAFGKVVESQTLEELETRKRNHDVLLKECLAVQDRLLGRGKMCLADNFYTIWEKLFDAGLYDEAMSLVEYGVEFLPFHTALFIFSHILDLFSMTSESQADSILSVIEKGLQCCAKRLQKGLEGKERVFGYHHPLAESCVKLLRAVIQLYQMDKVKSENEISNLVKELFPRSCKLYSILLLTATQLMVGAFTDFDFSSYKSLVAILLELGGNINEKDQSGRTILAYALQVTVSEDDGYEKQRQLVEFLLGKGASPAYLRKDARFPCDCVSDTNTLQLLRSHYPLSLQHLTAFAIIKSGIQYEGQVPEKMSKFIVGHK